MWWDLYGTEVKTILLLTVGWLLMGWATFRARRSRIGYGGFVLMTVGLLSSIAGLFIRGFDGIGWLAWGIIGYVIGVLIVCGSLLQQRFQR